MTTNTVNLFQRKRGPHDPGWLIHDCPGPMCHKCYMASWGWYWTYKGFWLNHWTRETLEDLDAENWIPLFDSAGE